MWFGIEKLLKVLVVCFFAGVILGFNSCTGNNEKKQLSDKIKSQSASEDLPGYVKFISFQNADSSWGFTVFVNSKPYLHYKQMPFSDSKIGFPTRNDAENIAAVFVKMIRNGDLTPELSHSTIDSLKLLERKKI
jgi:hypothetical protein